MRLIDMTARAQNPRPRIAGPVRTLAVAARVRLAALACVGLAVALAACGQSTPTGSPGPSAPPIVSSPTPPGSGSACPTALVVPAADNSRTLCVASGGTVTITAPPDQAQGWLPFDLGGNALRAATSTPTATGSDKVLAAFAAVAPGTSTVTSSHRNCPTTTTGMACNSIMLWRVTIVVK